MFGFPPPHTPLDYRYHVQFLGVSPTYGHTDGVWGVLHKACPGSVPVVDHQETNFVTIPSKIGSCPCVCVTMAVSPEGGTSLFEYTGFNLVHTEKVSLIFVREGYCWIRHIWSYEMGYITVCKRWLRSLRESSHYCVYYTVAFQDSLTLGFQDSRDCMCPLLSPPHAITLS